MTLADFTARVAAGTHLSCDEMTEAVDLLMRGLAADDDIGQFLLALRAKGETVEELAGAAAAMRRHMTPIRSSRTALVDTCGTGGDASGTFNISTAAAIVAAASGVAVAKHGNRSITSKSGSANALAALGVRIDAPVATVERCLDELGICFCFAPLLHPAMKHVAPVRQRLGVPTIFNLLGPLCNPASASFQLLGVGRRELRTKLAEALGLLGVKKGVVVSGADGLDEVTLTGPTDVSLVTSSGHEHVVWHPDDFGLEVGALDTLRVDGPAESAAMIELVLRGESGPARDIVVMNAAAALWTAGHDASLEACARSAAVAIDSGAAAGLLKSWIALSQTD